MNLQQDPEPEPAESRAAVSDAGEGSREESIGSEHQSGADNCVAVGGLSETARSNAVGEDAGDTDFIAEAVGIARRRRRRRRER